MNGYQRIMAALAREQPDGVPVMLHNFMMAAHEARISQSQYRSDPRVILGMKKTSSRCSTIAPRPPHDVVKDRICFIGNLDPSGVLALGTVDDVERATAQLIEAFSDTPRFILNAGCAIPANAPAENIEAMIRVARG